MATTSEAILIGIDDQVVELTGAKKTAFLAQREADQLENEAIENARIAKAAARQSALDKLTALGLTADEVAALIK
jgi:hypothetical protein